MFEDFEKCPFGGSLGDHLTFLTLGACCVGLVKAFTFIFTPELVLTLVQQWPK